MSKLAPLASFHADFEDTLEAEFADGALQPTAINIEKNGNAQWLQPNEKALLSKYFVPGFKGRGLSTLDEQTTIWINYAGEKNFNAGRCSIVFWMKYDKLVDRANSHLAFQIPGFMYILMAQRETRQDVALWIAPLGSAKQNTVYTVPWRPAPWHAGEWHQVALVWDSHNLRYYEDSVLLVREPLRRPIPAESKPSTFSVVLAGWNGKEKHHVIAVDEFWLFPFALTEEMIRATQKKSP